MNLTNHGKPNYSYEKNALFVLPSVASNPLHRTTVDIPPGLCPTIGSWTVGCGTILASEQHQYNPVAEWKVFAVAT